jgi:bifunctional DNA-binding transcriptional regulator/antitoxin component of YhaV-PrlF toxin-antitoxin module
MSRSTHITENGQVTIPKALREKYDLDPDNEVAWLDTDGTSSSQSARGRPRAALSRDATDETREEVAEELVERIRDRRERTDDEA